MKSHKEASDTAGSNGDVSRGASKETDAVQAHGDSYQAERGDQAHINRRQLHRPDLFVRLRSNGHNPLDARSFWKSGRAIPTTFGPL